MKKTAIPFALAVLAVAILALIASCKKPDANNLVIDQHESEWAVPLFKTSIGIEDILQKTLVDTAAKLLIDADGRMTFFYQGDLNEKYASELFKFGDSIVVPFLGTTEFKYSLDVPQKLHFQKVQFKGGKFTAGSLNLSGDTLLLKFYIDEMTKNGQPFVYNLVLPPTGGPYTSPDSLDIAGYTLEATDDTLHMHYQAYLKDGVTPTAVFGAALIGDNLQFSYIEGFWEKTEYPLTPKPDTIPIDIYSFVAGGGNIQFDDPRVTAYVINSYGFPTRALVKQLKVVFKDGGELDFLGQPVLNGIDANYPTLAEVGQTKVTEFYFDKNNSNIKEVFNSQPVSLIYDFTGVSNPDNDPNFIGFITDSSLVKLRVRVELPLRAYAKNFVVQDTLPVDFGGYSTLEPSKVRSAEFKIVTENEMPVGLSTQILFLDGKGNLIDSLFAGGETEFLKAAPVDANGEAVGKAVNEMKVPLTSAQFDRIRHATRAVLRARFNTSGGATQPVTALQKQRTNIRMGMRVVLFE